MSCKYVIARDGAIVLEHWTGTVTLAEMIEHKTHLAKELSLKPNASVLSDCRRATFEIPPDAISKLAEMEDDRYINSPITRYAFLVSDDVYDRAQQFVREVQKYGKTVIVFNSLDVAAVWLGMAPSEVIALEKNIAD